MQERLIRIGHSACPHDCPSTCALDIELLAGNRIGRVRGAKDHDYTNGVICAKVARYAERLHHPDRLLYPLRRKGSKGSRASERISWDDALTRIARHMKADRDKNFITQNAKGVTVNRWNTTGMLVSSASSNEAGYLSVKMLRAMGMVSLDTQARI